jgi:hypothetical protein
LRTTRYRGVDTATMIYDQLPINDVFRKLDDHSVIGAMDLRGSKKPYFFVLTRDNALKMRWVNRRTSSPVRSSATRSA